MKRIMLILVLLGLLDPDASGQELAGYEIVDNNAIGLTVAPFEKWGQAVADIDGNGWPDIFTIRWASPGFSRLYLNNEGIFQDITSQTPLESIESDESHTRTVALVDYDNDGDKDIFFGTDKRLYFLQNDNNVFTEISESIGLIGQKPPGLISQYQFNTNAWADFDLDGDLDVVVEQTNNPDFYLFRNDDGTFTNVSAEVGLTAVVPTGISSGAGGLTARLHWVDFDMDGDPDLSAGPFLFRNEAGQFTEVSESIGFAPGIASLTSEDIQNSVWFDFDNDGDLDFYKTVTRSSDNGLNELWENQGGAFVNVVNDFFPVELKDTYRGLATGDFDNDGDQDIFIQLNIGSKSDLLFLNDEVDGVRVFDDVAEFVGITKQGDRKGGAFMDYDMDGFLDLYIPSADVNHIMYHNLTNNNNWVGFILEGVQSSRDPVGALVTLVAEGRIQIRYKEAPSGWLRQNNPFIHFGLGLATTIDSMIVQWPSGIRQVLTDVAINQYHPVIESDVTSVNEPALTNTIPSTFLLRQNYPNPFNAGTIIEYSLPQASHVTLTVYNLQGQKIATLVDAQQNANIYQIQWDGRTDDGRHVATGVYLYRLKAGSFVDINKAVILK